MVMDAVAHVRSKKDGLAMVDLLKEKINAAEDFLQQSF